MLAVATDRQDPRIVQMILDHGADVQAKSLAGETALDWAYKTGAPGAIQSLGGALKPIARPIAASPPAGPRELREALRRSVGLLEKGAAEYFVKAGCFGCHAQGATSFAVEAARAKGFPVDDKLARERQLQVVAFLNSAGPLMMELQDLGGFPDSLAFVMESLARSGYAPSRLTDFMTASVAGYQWADGSWHIGGTSRTPIEDGDFSRTALSLRALKTYGSPGRAAEMKSRVDRAKQWLLRAKPAATEDYSMRLAGVASAGVDSATLASLARPLLSRQRADGGWAQREELASDAYATGMTLWALAESGVVQPADPVYQRGVKFLLSTQRADGSWYVASRAVKFQPYFEGGFPYGHDQWISSMATGWAANALALALDAPAAQSARAR
jgi:hypothetical protein